MGIRVGEAPKQRERWFVPPRLLTTTGADRDRRASWLELFFDLVFVVAITELSHQLVADHSAGGFLRFAALFVGHRSDPRAQPASALDEAASADTDESVPSP